MCIMCAYMQVLLQSLLVEHGGLSLETPGGGAGAGGSRYSSARAPKHGRGGSCCGAALLADPLRLGGAVPPSLCSGATGATGVMAGTLAAGGGGGLRIRRPTAAGDGAGGGGDVDALTWTSALGAQEVNARLYQDAD